MFPTLFFSLPFSCVCCCCCAMSVSVSVSYVCLSLLLYVSSSIRLLHQHQQPRHRHRHCPRLCHRHRHHLRRHMQLKPNAELRLRTPANGVPPARPPPPMLPPATQPNTPASYYNHPYASNCSSSNPPEAKLARATSTPTKTRALATTDSSFDSPPDVQSPPIPPRRQCSANAVVAATAAAVSAGINRLERNCWQDEPNDSLRGSNTSTGSTSSSSSSSCCSSAASFVTAASRFSQLNISSPMGSEPAPIPTPRAKREVHQLRV